MFVNARLSLHVLNTIEQTTSKFLLFSVVARIRFNQVASESKYLDLSMESLLYHFLRWPGAGGDHKGNEFT